MFYLVLPSNSSHSFYPNNTVTNYKTRLPQDIDLTGKWEVGLEEIQYSHDWFSFASKTAIGFAYTYTDFPNKNNQNDEYTWIEEKLNPGYYANKGEIVDTINDILKASKYDSKLTDKIKLSWKKNSDIVTIKAAAGTKLLLTEELRDILGFENDQLFFNDVFHSTKKGILNQQFTALYVYCDIVSPRIVGDSVVSLLRTVPITKDHGNSVYHSFHNVHYLPLITNNFQDIEIDIRDDAGKRIPFEGGRVVVTLHFRKIRLL